MASITGANATILLSIAGLFPAPQQLQGFAADDVFDSESIDSAETLMGVDGFMSAGFVYVPVNQTFTLQADSPSIPFFDVWYLQQVAGLTTYTANGVTILPAIKKKFIMTTGYLIGYKPLPAGKKLLQPQRFRLRFNLSAAIPIQ